MTAFLRIAGAIVFDTIAFSIWDIGTRSPAAVLRELRSRAGERRSVLLGLLRFVIGAALTTAAIVLIVPAVANPPIDFAPSELFTLLVALALEHLVGADIRTLWKTGVSR